MRSTGYTISEYGAVWLAQPYIHTYIRVTIMIPDCTVKFRTGCQIQVGLIATELTCYYDCGMMQPYVRLWLGVTLGKWTVLLAFQFQYKKVEKLNCSLAETDLSVRRIKFIRIYFTLQTQKCIKGTEQTLHRKRISSLVHRVTVHIPTTFKNRSLKSLHSPISTYLLEPSESSFHPTVAAGSVITTVSDDIWETEIRATKHL